MLLVTDIGNTNIVFGGLQDGTFRFRARIATDRKKSSDQYSMTIRKLMRLNGVDPEEISDCIISSVVPPVLNSVRTGLQKILNRKPMVVGPGLKTGLNIQVEDPARVGSDRIVAAVGALISHEAPLILLDMGTATTLEVVGRGNTYLGGCIIPGVRTALDGLISHSAQLPGISLEAPKNVIGKNTEDCLKKRPGLRCCGHDRRHGGENRGGAGGEGYGTGYRRHCPPGGSSLRQRDHSGGRSASQRPFGDLQQKLPEEETNIP